MGRAAAPGTIAYGTTTSMVRPARTGPRSGAPVRGRYTEVKRIPMLIRAYARAREHFVRPRRW